MPSATLQPGCLTDDQHQHCQSNRANPAQCARLLLDQHPCFASRTRLFEFECTENVLIVRGRVPTYYVKQLLQTALMGLQGVERIDNQVDVVGLHS
jgi:hypothetical protein